MSFIRNKRIPIAKIWHFCVDKRKSRHSEAYELDIIYWIYKSACVAKWLERPTSNQ